MPSKHAQNRREERRGGGHCLVMPLKKTWKKRAVARKRRKEKKEKKSSSYSPRRKSCWRNHKMQAGGKEELFSTGPRRNAVRKGIFPMDPLKGKQPLFLKNIRKWLFDSRTEKKEKGAPGKSASTFWRGKGKDSAESTQKGLAFTLPITREIGGRKIVASLAGGKEGYIGRKREKGSQS